MNVKREARLNQALDQIIQCLVTEYHPEKIILFGSMASGEIKEWSDLDLVIIKETSQPFFQRLREVALLCQPSVGVDFLVYTAAEFDRMLAERNPFIVEEIVRKGKVLYERQSVEAMA